MSLINIENTLYFQEEIGVKSTKQYYELLK